MTNAFDQAVEFAKDIIRKRKAAIQSVSPKLKHDYNKSINSDMQDIIFYAQCHHLDMQQVWDKAFEESANSNKNS